MKGTTLQWIEDQKVPYATKNSEWVGFDTKDSYETKVGGISALEFNIFITNTKYLRRFIFMFAPIGALPAGAEVWWCLCVGPRFG